MELMKQGARNLITQGVLLVLAAIALAWVFAGCSNPAGGIPVDTLEPPPEEPAPVAPDPAKIRCSVDSTLQYHEFPSAYYSEISRLKADSLATRRMYQEMYQVGAISASEFEANISKVNEQLAADLQALEAAWLEKDIYTNTLVIVTLLNENPVDARVKTVLEVQCGDGTVFQFQVETVALRAGEEIKRTIVLATLGKETGVVRFKACTVEP